ncbi:MAG: M56 family metallopeptidase [Pirellulaceae bacterium]
MNVFLSAATLWLIDFLVLATALLSAVLALRMVLREPAQRVALAWAAWLGMGLLGVLVALPAWPRQPLGDFVNFQRELQHSVPAERQVAELSWEADDAAGIVSHEATILDLPLSMHDTLPATANLPAASPLAFDEWVAAVWLLGAGLAGGWMLLGRVQARWLLRGAAHVPAWVQAELASIVGQRASPGLWASGRVSTAVALGALRPQVVLPAESILEQNRTAIRAALAHEWAHIRHGDLWLLALERLLLPLLFMHPLFWWLRRGVRLDQELLADAAAAGDQPVQYAEALLTWAKSAKNERHGLAALSMWEHPSPLSRRVNMILNPKRRPSQAIGRWWTAALAALLVPAVIGLSLFTLRPLTAQEEEAAEAEPAAVPTEPAPAAPSYQEDPGPAPWPAMVPVTKIQLEMLILSVNREKLAEAMTSLEDFLQDSPRINLQREAGLVVSDDIRPDDVLELIKWLKQHDAVKILSRPSAITLDGREAHFSIGGEAPILRVEETINGKHERRIEYQRFGTTLTVRPKISDKNRNLIALDFTAEQANLLSPGEKAEEGGAARDVPGLVSHKFTLHADEVALGGSLLVAESPADKRDAGKTAKEQFVAIVTLHEVVHAQAPVYSDPAAGQRGEAKRKATQAALDAATKDDAHTPHLRVMKTDVPLSFEYLVGERDPVQVATLLEDKARSSKWHAFKTIPIRDPKPARVVILVAQSDARQLADFVGDAIGKQKTAPLAKDAENVPHLVPDHPLVSPPTLESKPPAPLYPAKPKLALRVYPLKYLKAAEVQKQLEAILSKSPYQPVKIMHDPRANALIVEDDGRSGGRYADEIAKLIESLDQPAKADEPKPMPAPARENPSPSTELRLLELDREEADASLQIAEAELQAMQEIRAKNPGAASPAELRKFEFQVQRAKIQLERINVRLEGLKSQPAQSPPSR